MIRWQLAAIAALAAGCAPRPAETFSFSGTQLVWPLPPDPPRIRYIGQIVGEASLGHSAGLGEALKAVVQGAAPPRAFSTPTAVAVAGMQVFVADPSHPAGPCVHAVDLAAKTISVIEIAAGAPLKRPIDLAIHGQALAVADSQRAAVFLFGLDGRFQRTVGAGELNRPAAVAWSSDGALLWVLDSAAHEAVAFTRDGRRSHSIGGRGSTEGLFNFPAGFCTARQRETSSAEGDRLAIADSMNFRVQIVDGAGQVELAFGRKGDAAGSFSLPRDVAADSTGNLYVLDNQFENVQIFDPRGRLLMAWGGEGAGPGLFALPSGITIDDQDRIWIADAYNRRVQVFQRIAEASP